MSIRRIQELRCLLRIVLLMNLKSTMERYYPENPLLAILIMAKMSSKPKKGISMEQRHPEKSGAE